jgi:hypothetical protein
MLLLLVLRRVLLLVELPLSLAGRRVLCVVLLVLGRGVRVGRGARGRSAVGRVLLLRGAVLLRRRSTVLLRRGGAVLLVRRGAAVLLLLGRRVVLPLLSQVGKA